MAQLLIKKSSWWEFSAKQALIWVPVAAVQASTLGGLGYFYHRLNVLEAQPTRQPVTPQLRVSRIPPPPPPAATPTLWPVALDSPQSLGFMRVGQDFSSLAASSPRAVSTMSARKTPTVLPATSKPVEKASHVRKNSDAERVARANQADPTVKLKKAIHVTTPPVEVLELADVADVDVPTSVVIPAEVPRGKPLPVGLVAWVYLGELRDYGWYGQRLHIAPDSGLPEIGAEYRTQKIHGIYDQPHGNRTMGGFQQGDVVSILDVRHEANNGVWAKVRKTRAVGH